MPLWHPSLSRASEHVPTPGAGPWRISLLPSLSAAAPSPLVAMLEDPRMSSPRRWAPQIQQKGRKLVVKKQVDLDEKSSDYRGHYRRWPGIVLFLFLMVGSVSLMTTQAMKVYTAKCERVYKFERRVQTLRRIQDGTANNQSESVSSDGQVGNPMQYDTTEMCLQPDYQSKHGQLFAVSPDGTETPFQIKGVNWFGMETAIAAPFGLWQNPDNGTTVYEIAAFLERNGFNAVRLPISLENLLSNNPPRAGMINKSTNRALNLTNFITALQSIIKALAYRKIGVVISMHTLTNGAAGASWFDSQLGVSQSDFLAGISTLSTKLCTQEYWNVMGIDLKNEPTTAEWGTGSDNDFVKGAEKIAAVMHQHCPKWLGFVEGIVGDMQVLHMDDGKAVGYYNWWGGGLQGANRTRPQFSIPNKLVWAPHYYSTAVSPQLYFYGSNTKEDFSVYEELGDNDLNKRVQATMHDMFGYLAEENSSALLLGEFAGLYSKDAHPKQTTKRTTDYVIQTMLHKNYAGGFMWSLNPESLYQYNPANVKGSFYEGLLSEKWLSPNKPFLKAFEPMNAMPNLHSMPCYPVENTALRRR